MEVGNEHASRDRHCRPPNSLKITDKPNSSSLSAVRYYEKPGRNFENVLVQIAPQHAIDTPPDSLVLSVLGNLGDLTETVFAMPWKLVRQ